MLEQSCSSPVRYTLMVARAHRHLTFGSVLLHWLLDERICKLVGGLVTVSLERPEMVPQQTGNLLAEAQGPSCPAPAVMRSIV